MPRTAISGLICTTSLVLLGFPAVSQEPPGKGADTESGQLTFNNACRTCHTIKEGDNRCSRLALSQSRIPYPALSPPA